jgi:hypothetical protein
MASRIGIVVDRQARREAYHPGTIHPWFLPVYRDSLPSVACGLPWRRLVITVTSSKVFLNKERTMLGFIAWLVLLFLCWPVALLALLLYPLVWLVLLPFRLIGIGVEAVFELLRAIVMLPARVLGASPGR